MVLQKLSQQLAGQTTGRHFGKLLFFVEVTAVSWKQIKNDCSECLTLKSLFMLFLIFTVFSGL